MSARSTLRRRPSRIVPATIVAVVLTAVGVLAVIAGTLRLAEGAWPTAWTSTLDAVTAASWASTPVWVAVIALAVIGLVLLLAAIVPGSHRTARLGAPTDAGGQREVAVTTRGLARIAAAAADTVDGVDGVSVAADRRAVRVRVRSSSSDDAPLVRDHVQRVVTDRLHQLALQPAPRVRVAVTVKES